MDDVIEPDRWARLDDYFADRLPLAERIEMERWVAEREDRRSVIAELREVWKRAEQAGAAADIGPVDIRQVLNTLAERREAIDAAARSARTSPARGVPIVPLRRRFTIAGPYRRASVIAAVAAAMVLAVGLPVLVYRSDDAQVVSVPPAREVITKRGQQAALDLADGSRVVLAPGSRLRIPGDFNVPGANGRGARRELYLEGKAHFAVEHDSTRPFIVRTATAVTEDLGTEFVVSAYPESRATQVAVVSGLVELSDVSDASVTRLQPGDVGRMDSTGSATVAHNVALAPYVSWTRGVLAFDAVPLREALADLSRWYDVDFELRSRALDHLRITGEFREEPVERAMQRLALMLDVRVTQNGRSVRLSPKRISP